MLVRFFKNSTWVRPAFVVGFLFFSFIVFVPQVKAFSFISQTIVEDTVWTTENSPYMVNYLGIASGKTLTINPGVVVKLGISSIVNVDGNLDVNGTATEPVYFTSYMDDSVLGDSNEDGGATTAAPGDWGGVLIGKYNTSAAASFDHTIFKFAGYSSCWSWCAKSAVYIEGGNTQINNSQILSSGFYGIYQAGGSLEVSDTETKNNQYGYILASGSGSFNNSSFITNNVYDVIANNGSLVINNSTFSSSNIPITVNAGVNFVHSNNKAIGTGIRGIAISGTLNQNQVWSADLPYVVSGLTVSSGVTLTLNPGVIIKFKDGVSTTIEGNLVAVGTVDDPISFTSINDDLIGGDTNNDGSATAPARGDWDSILIGMNSSDATAVFNNVEIKYGGRYPRTWAWCYQSSIYVNSGTVSVSNAHISYSEMFGIKQLAGSVEVENTELDHNGIGYYYGAGDISVSNSAFHDSSYSGFTNGNASTISLTNNWWGNASGPYNALNNPTGTGDRVSDRVVFSTWLTTDPIVRRQLIKVAVVLFESANMDHSAASFTAQPCKLITQKTYSSGHSTDYYNDIIYCLKEYYKENFIDTLRFKFDFINEGTWHVGQNNENVYAANVGTLMNEVVSVSGLDTSQYNIVLALHSGASKQLSSNNNKITTQTLRGQTTYQSVVLSEDDLLGGWAHEIGRALGVLTVVGNDALSPNLYKMGKVEAWDVMATGSYNVNRNDPPNMSSYTKEYFGLLTEDIHAMSYSGTSWINSLETSKKGNTVFRYNLENSSSSEAERYYLVETRNKNFGTWDTSVPATSSTSGNVVLYYVNTKGFGEYDLDSSGKIINESRIITIPKSSDIPNLNNNGVLAINDVYKDLDSMVKFSSLDERVNDSKYEMQVNIQPITNVSSEEEFTGAVLRPQQTYRYVSESVGVELPNLDLHAYCAGGKHIGVNYETGLFENQITGSIVSGDNGGASQWIYVPVTVTGCKYYVSSERNQQFLDEHPDIAAVISNTSDMYDLYARYTNPQTGLYTSTIHENQVIPPGVMMVHEVSGTTDISISTGTIGVPNQAPVANDQSVSVTKETLSTITLSASDSDGIISSYKITSLPANGTLYRETVQISGCTTTAPCVFPDGSLSYLGNVDFVGTNSFTFIASDGDIDSNEAQVTIQVVSTP